MLKSLNAVAIGVLRAEAGAAQGARMGDRTHTVLRVPCPECALSPRAPRAVVVLSGEGQGWSRGVVWSKLGRVVGRVILGSLIFDG